MTQTQTRESDADSTAAEPIAVTDTDPQGGTRWRRVGTIFVPAVVVMLLMAFGALEGYLPLRLTVVGQDLKLTSNGGAVETSSGLTLYPTQITMKDGSKRGVLIAGIDHADLPKGLCISLTLTFPVVGTYTVRLHTSGNTQANGMILDASGLHASSADLAPLTRSGQPTIPVSIGKDSGQLRGADGAPSGRFGVESPGAGSLTDLQASAEGAVIAGTATLKGVSIHIADGRGTQNGECF